MKDLFLVQLKTAEPLVVKDLCKGLFETVPGARRAVKFCKVEEKFSVGGKDAELVPERSRRS